MSYECLGVITLQALTEIWRMIEKNISISHPSEEQLHLKQNRLKSHKVPSIPELLQ